MAVDWTERIIEGVIVGTITSIIVLTVIPPAVTAAMRQIEMEDVAKLGVPVQELM